MDKLNYPKNLREGFAPKFIPNYSSWERFIYSGEIPKELRPLIKESWKRCANAKVNPQGISLARVIPAKELKARTKRRSKLLKIAAPYVEILYELLHNTGFTIMITDEEGVVLLLRADEEERECNKRINLIEGAIWTESEVGTNAVGLALILGQPVQIVGGEHYCAIQHEITCSASPIYNEDGELIGILNMSGESEKVHPHTLGMVVSAAKAIENQIRICNAMSEVCKAKNAMETVIKTVNCGLLALDETGRVNQINPAATRIISGGSSIIGKTIDEVFKCNPPLSRIVEKGTTFNHKEVYIENDKNSRYFIIDGYPIIGGKDNPEGAVIIIRSNETVNQLVNEVTGAQAQFTFQSIKGNNNEILKAKEIARNASFTNSTVLLLGESGTGKELFAQSIHNASYRKGPFIAVNCGAIPRTLIESELFGYESGSFTGANRQGRSGKFERANGGTIFLDEIGDMPLDLQTVLLRVLQEREVVRVGGYKSIPINVRVIAATNTDLFRKVEEGVFREDLYYRLNVVTVNIPPLRERKEDIPTLINYLLPNIGNRLNKIVADIETKAFNYLVDYYWPGNIRELENVLERSVIVCKNNTIQVNDLPENIVKGSYSKKENQKVDLLTIAEMEKKLIESTLAKANSVLEAACSLGISRSTLYRKIDQYRIEVNS